MAEKENKTNDAAKENALPALHTMPYPEKYKPDLNKSGATAFFGKTDHQNSRYYVFNDYYNMESDETLHILSYQQTTEYTCGAACALMVLNWFGRSEAVPRAAGRPAD